jgi:MFS family permease
MLADPERHRRDRRAIVGDGVSFSLMVGMGESYLAAFVLAGGLGEVAAGLVATVPMLAGAVLQLVSPAAVRRLRSHRRWVVLCALLQAASLVPLVAQALAGRVSGVWVYAAATAYWGFGFATGPAWNTWVGTLVPPEERARFFAMRSRWCQAAVLVGVVGAGVLLEWGGGRAGSGAPPGSDGAAGAAAGGRELELALFGGLFAAACLARLASAGFLASQSEPVPLPEAHRNVSFADFARRFRTTPDGRLLGYLLSMQISVHLAAPFFTPYLLGPLALSYGGYTALTAAVFVARILAMPALGRIAHRHGARRLLWAGALAITPLPVLWLVTDSFPFLLGIQIAAGCAWGAVELAILLSYFEHIPAAERTGVLTIFNLATAVAMAAGATAGAFVFELAGGGRAAFATLFALSTAARALALVALRGVHDVSAPAEPLELRTVAVRPNAGALQRPILPTAHADDEER